MTLRSLVRLFSLVMMAAVILTAEAGNYCCTPMQYVINGGQINGLELPSGQGVAQLNALGIAFDYESEKIGEEIITSTSGQVTKIKIIIDYKENVMYTIIGQTCTKTEARGVFERCIPKTAHFDGSVYLGDNELTIDTYSYYADVPKVSRGNTTLSVTHGGCIPVGATLIGEATQTEPPIKMVSVTGFNEFKNGISDPGKWFDVPSICQKSRSAKFRRSVHPISDDHKAATDLVSIFNSMMLPTFKKP